MWNSPYNICKQFKIKIIMHTAKNSAIATNGTSTLILIIVATLVAGETFLEFAADKCYLNRAETLRMTFSYVIKAINGTTSIVDWPTKDKWQVCLITRRALLSALTFLQIELQLNYKITISSSPQQYNPIQLSKITSHHPTIEITVNPHYQHQNFHQPPNCMGN